MILLSKNSEFGRCDFLYSGAFLGWPAGEGQRLKFVQLRSLLLFDFLR